MYSLLIIGGSYAGISTAHYLLKHVIPKLPNPASYQVILLSASTQVMNRPGTVRALISDDIFPQDKFFVPIPPLFEEYPPEHFRFIHATATKLDHANRTVSFLSQTTSAQADSDETIPFHALIIATGASTPSPLFSMNAGDTTTVRESWAAFRAALPKAKSIVISGGGPTSVETAGELGEYLNGSPGWFAGKLTNPKVPITLVTSRSDILPLLRPALGKRAEGFLARVGVTVIKNTRVTDAKPSSETPTSETDGIGARTTVTLSDGQTLEADIYIPATGYSPNTGFVPESLLAEDKRVEINPATFRVDKAGVERVYAVGDVAAPLRPSIPNVRYGVPVVCANIKKDLMLEAGETGTSAGADRVYKEDRSETSIVPVGRSAGVGAIMGWQVPGCLVRWIKGRDYWLGMSGDVWSGKQWAKEA